MTRFGRGDAARAAALVAIFIACAVIGGAAGGIDQAVAAEAAALREGSPLLLPVALFLTDLGSAPLTLGLGAAGALMLVARRRYLTAAILFVTIIAERLAVDGLKLFFGRARPLFDTDLVHVYNLSFPSGHSANSLTAYVLFACFVVPRSYRSAAIAAAFAISIIVGLTRIVLGVHWLSDVVGGWSAGLIAIMLALAAERRLRAPEH